MAYSLMCSAWDFTLGRSTTTALPYVFHNIMQVAESGNDIIEFMYFDR